MKDINDIRRSINEIDASLAELFEKRMAATREIAEYKAANGLPILDKAREAEVIKRNSEHIKDPELIPYYLDFIKSTMRISKERQAELIFPKSDVAKLTVLLGEQSYPLYIGAGILGRSGELLHLSRKAIVVTDSGVPREYAKTIASACKEASIFTFPMGEESKSLATLEAILTEMMTLGLQRGDCAIAVGGGVVGDITALAASLYMRGIDFYNVPTTLLSQLDSSIGGKCAVDLCGVKNTVGTFYQPKGVIIDTETLATLDKRQYSAGLAEAVKMAATSDKELFADIESGLAGRDIKELICRSLAIKKRIVEDDERESGPRRILNFGHTLGHGIEALGGRLHGECVALGMLPMASEEIRGRLKSLLASFGLETEASYDLEAALALMKHDKKCEGGSTHAVFVDEIGNGRIERISFAELCLRIRKNT